MTHITIAKKSNSKPSLEFYSDGSGEVRRITIEHFPFRIGRAEGIDLRVESVEVSREHAEIVERNGVWLVRDLGSTNGTQLNGQQITEAILADGDIIRVAQSELTFTASVASQFQRMVTQPIQSNKAAVLSSLPTEVSATRMITEATLWQAIPAQLLSVTSIRHGVTEAYFAPLANLKHAQTQEISIFDQPHAVADRYRELIRLRAVESATDQAEANRLFLSVSPAEIESPHRMFAGLKQLHALLPAGWELGITISLPSDIDILCIADVYRHAQDQELLVAYDDFQGNGAQVMHLKSQQPDYLILSPTMTRDLSTTRQPIRRLESLLQACEELGIKPVLPQIDQSQTVIACQEIGFDLVLSTATSAAARRAELSVTV